jgi:O-antigen/teichoic acid export membrane protein
MACLWVPVNVAATIALDLLRVEFRPRTYAALAVGRSAIASAAGVIAAGPLGFGVAGLLAAHAVTTALAALLGLWLTRSSWTLTIDRAAVRQLVPFGLPLVTFGIALWVIGFSDRFFVIQFLGTTAAGIYSLASRGAALVGLVMFAFEAAWLPLAMNLSGRPGHHEAYARIFTTVGAGLVGLAIFLSLFAREVIFVVATPDFADAAAFVGVLALGQAIYGVGQVVAIGLQLGKRTGSLLWISAAAAALNVVLTIVLVPRIGIAGAGLATVIAYALSASLIYVMAQRAYPVPYPVRLVVLAMAIGSAAMAGGLLLDAQVARGTWISIATFEKVLIAFVAGGALWSIHRRRASGTDAARAATVRRSEAR